MKTMLSVLGIGRILALAVCGLLAAMAFFLKFCVPGYSFSALVCICLIGLILFYTFMPVVGLRFPVFARYAIRIFTVILIIGLLVVGIMEAVIIHASFGNPEEKVEYMVVLGAKVNKDGPSVSLWDRICGAYEYMEANPHVIAVVSGGQGTDEPITEAECMYRELVNLGIDPKRIWREEEATSTWENLNFTLDLIEEKTGVRPQKLGVLSSEYHLFRASLFAKACNVEFVGIPARTSRASQMINHFMREVAGVWHYILLGGQYD
ncbi:MAG: YdcF family protein [Oscillospiraceae bacterium]|nr:YdcF family protein [Oscillospiraceae bacterium]MBQ7130629.1 YdcF family protein [Oscillospiraceae bacterium]